LSLIIRRDGLSPSIKTAIMEGRQPIDLTLEKLLRQRAALDWDEQPHKFRFAV